MNEIEKVKILVVDDEADILDILENAFIMFGFNIKTASSGNEAIELLKTYKADTVISDIRMPNGNGLQLLQHIKKQDVHYPKVLFLSGFTDHSAEELYDKGVDGFFSKPFSASEIRDTLERSSKTIEERWHKKHIHVEPVLRIETSIATLNQLSTPTGINWGRGGFFIEHNDTDTAIAEDLIEFAVKIQDEKPCKVMSGIGRLKWIRHAKTEVGPQGFGVEIFSLDDSCLLDLIRWHKNNNSRAYIPSN